MLQRELVLCSGRILTRPDLFTGTLTITIAFLQALELYSTIERRDPPIAEMVPALLYSVLTLDSGSSISNTPRRQWRIDGCLRGSPRTCIARCSLSWVEQPAV